jgi:hypothetical protein
MHGILNDTSVVWGDAYLVAVRAVGDARGRYEWEHNADVAWVWEISEHERVFKVASTGAAVRHRVILQAAAEGTPAEVVLFLLQTLAIDANDEAVVESVEHQPRSLFLKQAFLVTCVVCHGQLILSWTSHGQAQHYKSLISGFMHWSPLAHAVQHFSALRTVKNQRLTGSYSNFLHSFSKYSSSFIE